MTELQVPKVANISCRLCSGTAQYRFTLRMLVRYEVAYFECTACGCLQTEQPYWLDMAYGIPGVHIDVGQAARIVQTWLRLSFLLEKIGFEKSADCIDYGGSTGLLTRLMRDTGFNFFAFDTYDTAKYANYFKIDRLADKSPAFISAFEVFEHFPDPRPALDELFAVGADLIVFTTQFYEGQDANWDYLVPDCGQHVFFYRREALATVAAEKGYTLLRALDLWILIRQTSLYREKVIDLEDAVLPSEYGGGLLSRVGWGGEQTQQDHVYAKARFQRELEQSNDAPRSWLQRLVPLRSRTKG